MSKLNATQRAAIGKAVRSYNKLLNAGASYGEAMRAAAKALGDTPCITLLEGLARVHARKYQCNYAAGGDSFVFFDGAESTRETKHQAAAQSWNRNVMVWFKPAKVATPTSHARISAEARAAAKTLLKLCGSVTAAKAALDAVK